MPSLPLVVTIGSAPPELVTRVTVSAGYTLQNQKWSAGSQSFDAGGGVFVGDIRSDPLGAYPATATVNVTVDYAPATGLTGFTQEVTPADVGGAGVHVYFDVPNQLDRPVRVSFRFNLNPKEVVSLRWDQLVAGAVVKGDAVDVPASPGAAPLPPTPAELTLRLSAPPPGKVNTLRLRAEAATTFQGQALDPFDQTFPVDGQVIVLDAAPASPGRFKLVATTTA